MAKKPIKNAIHLIFQVFCVFDYVFLVFSEHFFVMMRVLVVLTVVFGNLHKPYGGPNEDVQVLHVRLFGESSQQGEVLRTERNGETTHLHPWNRLDGRGTATNHGDFFRLPLLKSIILWPGCRVNNLYNIVRR